MSAAVGRIQQGSVGNRCTTNIRKDLVDGEKSRPESDFVHPGIFIWDTRLLVFRSTNRVIRWEESIFCMSCMSSNYHLHYQGISRITSPTLAVNESGSNWFSTCQREDCQPPPNSCFQTTSVHAFPTVTTCVSCEDPDAVRILGTADVSEGVESWLRTSFTRPIRNDASIAEAISIYISRKGVGET